MYTWCTSCSRSAGIYHKSHAALATVGAARCEPVGLAPGPRGGTDRVPGLQSAVPGLHTGNAHHLTRFVRTPCAETVSGV